MVKSIYAIYVLCGCGSGLVYTYTHTHTHTHTHIHTHTQQSQQLSHSQVVLDSGNTNTSLSPNNCHSMKCCCGKICKGIRGLKMHQRTCRVVKDLTEETFEFVEENLTDSYNNDNYNENLDTNITSSILDSKPGVKLLKIW